MASSKNRHTLRTSYLSACICSILSAQVSAQTLTNANDYAAAAANAVGDTVLEITQDITNLDPANASYSFSPSSLTLKSSELNVRRRLSPVAGSVGRAFQMPSGDVDSIRDIEFVGFTTTPSTTIPGQYWSSNGSAFALPGAVKNGIHNSRFEDNKTVDINGGGGFYAGTFSGGIWDTTFKRNEGNAGGGSGGGFIVLDEFSGGLHNVDFIENKAYTSGGFVVDRFSGGISGGSFIGNEATGTMGSGDAGGFSVRLDFTGDISGTLFNGNTAEGYGGGFVTHGNFFGGIKDGARFSGNAAKNGNGGGFDANKIFGDIDGVIFGFDGVGTFDGNTAKLTGGGFHAMEMTGTIKDTWFGKNSAGHSGGGFSIAGY